MSKSNADLAELKRLKEAREDLVVRDVLIASRPVVRWNIIAVVINFLSVGAYLYFVRREREQGTATPRA
jgi:hypothetical protein